MNKPKRTVSWFRHYCRHGDSLKVVESLHGPSGYTCWFKLLERLGAADDHQLNMDADIRKFMLIWAESGLKPDEGREVFALFAELEMIDKELHEHGIIWCQHLVDGVSELYAKRSGAIPTRPEYTPEIAKTAPAIAKGGDIKTGIRIEEVEEVEEGKRKKNISCPDSLPLAGRLAELILDHQPNNAQLKEEKKDATIERWAYDIDLMQRRDKREPEHILKVIEWAQNHDFWRTNIMSGSKLREQYDQLEGKMKKGGGKTAGQKTIENGQKALEDL